MIVAGGAYRQACKAVRPTSSISWVLDCSTRYTLLAIKSLACNHLLSGACNAGPSQFMALANAVRAPNLIPATPGESF